MRNSTLMNGIQAQGDANFKNMNNLLSLQDNHVENFSNITVKRF